jgi:hypothetical protein
MRTIFTAEDMVIHIKKEKENFTKFNFDRILDAI